MKKIPYAELVEFVADRDCLKPEETRGEKYEVAWGENRRDYTYEPCKRCLVCRAKKQLNLKNEPWTVTH